MLEALGLGPSGPPVPPPTTFSVVPFPRERVAPRGQLTRQCLSFLVPSGSDESGDDRTGAAEASAETLAPPAKVCLCALTQNMHMFDIDTMHMHLFLQ